MQRSMFQLQVKPDHVEAYRAAHAAVWRDMLEALRDTGWRNYSIFLRDDGLVTGYFEAEDLEAAQAAMGRTEVNARWQAAMAEHFESAVTDDQAPARYLVEVFNLDDQLGAP
jgi:L-rhamnose mutarotase